MKEIVKRIMETEKAVRERIERTREDAQAIVRDAEARSRVLVEESRQEAVRKGQELIDGLKQKAEAERDRQVARVKGGSAELIGKKEKEINRAVERITRLVIGGDEQ